MIFQVKSTFIEQHVNPSSHEDKPHQHVKDNNDISSCTCNAAEKSVRFNLPTKTRASTSRNESQKSNESSCKHLSGGRYQRKGHGNVCKGCCQEYVQASCNNGKLMIIFYFHTFYKTL